MEWVETTGQSVELAKEAALDRLGVDRSEAEFEVLEEAQTGWFGRVKAEARVRARVAPTTPRPKQERRDRGNKKSGGNNRNNKRGGSGNSNKQGSGGNQGSGNNRGSNDSGGRGKAAAGAAALGGAGAAAAASGRGSNNKSNDSGSGNARSEGSNDATSSSDGGRSNNDRGNSNNRNNKQSGGKGRSKVHNESDMSVPDQAEVAKTFMEGLLENMGLAGTVGIENVLEDEATVQVAGENVGLLVGPGGRTLNSLQELSRTVIQRHAGGSPAGRIRIDVGGYRARRKEALEKFVADIAAKVTETGKAQALEPMGSADRKIVHDAANEIAGIGTTSEGEDPRRRVVIVPAE